MTENIMLGLAPIEQGVVSALFLQGLSLEKLPLEEGLKDRMKAELERLGGLDLPVSLALCAENLTRSVDGNT